MGRATPTNGTGRWPKLDCYGNDVAFPNESELYWNYLLGSKYTVTQPIVLQKAGIIFNGPGISNAKVGIYTDAGGVPNTLVAETGSFEVYLLATVLETPLLTTPTIPAGDYWFMAVFDTISHVSVGISYDDGAQAAYIAHPFNSPLPATFPAPNIYTGQAFNYYLVGETTIYGDYNNNDTVDAADYVVWRDSLNTLPIDSTPGTVTVVDYDVWRSHFGQIAASGAGANANATVPEPGTLVLLMLAPAGWCLRRSRSA